MPEFKFKYSNLQQDIKRFSGIEDIIKATQNQNFISPFINQPEKTTGFPLISPKGMSEAPIVDAPRKREADKVTQGILRGATAPVLGAYQELGNAGDELKKGEVGSGIMDLLKGTLHTAMTPITAPISAVSEGLKGTGQVGGEVAKGLEQTMQLPFDAIKYGSELVKKSLEAVGIDTTDSKWSAKANELIQEIGGLYAMGKTHRSVKSYLDKKIPELKVLPKDPEITIKPQETAPVEGLTQEKSITDLMPKIETKVEQQGTLPEPVRYYESNKIAIKNILDQDPSLSGNPRMISKRLTALKEEGKLFNKVSIESIKKIADEWIANRPKPKVQEIKSTPSTIGLSIPEEMNSKRAVSFDKNTGLTIKEILDQNPEFKPFVKDLTDVNEVTTQLNSLYQKKRSGEKLPEIKNSETSFDFGANKDLSPKQIMENSAQEYPTPKAIKDAQTILGDKFSTEFEKFKKEIEPNNNAPEGNKLEMFARRVVAADKLGINELLGDKFYNAYEKSISTSKNETTSVKNELMNQQREYRGLDPLQTKEVRKQDAVYEDAKQKIDSGEIDPNKLAKEIVDSPRILNDTDVAVLGVNARRLKNESMDLVNKISKETDPVKIEELRKQSLILDEQYNINDIASKQTGTDTARALAIRRLELQDDYSIAPLKQRARIANKGEAISEELTIKLEQYSKKIAEADAKVKQYQEQLSRVQAEKVLQDALKKESFDQRTQKRQVKKQDLDVEYETLVKEFAKTQQYNVLVDPKQIEIMVKAVKNRVQKGAVNLAQAVDQIYQDMSKYMPELTKQDIYDAIGGLGRFQKMSEADIKSELGQIRKTRTDESLQKAYKTRLLNRKTELEEMLRTGNYEKAPRRKTQMNPELSKLKDEVDILKQHANREIRLLGLKNRTTSEKIKDTIIDIGNVPRTVMASFDLSAPLRQGVVLLASHPKIGFGEGGAFREMFKYFKSDKALRDLQRYIEDSPNAPLYIKSKLYLANEKANIGRISGREEAFMSTLPEKIPLFGSGIRASNRAYAGFLDKLRMDVFDSYVEQLNKSGITFESNPKAFKDIGSFINQATGRGTLGGFERSASALSLGLFSPRLIASRLQLMNPATYLKLDPIVRKLAMKDMIKFVGVGLTTLSLAKLAGAEVETDSRSTDFGKIKLGNTRLDVWGGFQQYIVPMARIITNESKSVNGKITKLDGKEFPFNTKLDIISRLGRQKLSPSIGFTVDWLAGKDMMGNKFELPKDALELITPLYLRDMYDAVQEGNIESTLATIPAIFGVGVQTYKQKKPALKF